ncbi:MAG TPA: carboxypeptidase-like regulatory domain-containing protein [Chitinophagaceae bacterium]|nr:carboxypeptidase-like regulatory domain-containing protein [Chitinophagaceae bacterium]
MRKKLQLSIPTPCHEKWDNMTPVQQGKFCGSCQKSVVDFSNMSDRQVAEFFKKPSAGSVCGRFMQDQLDRSIEIPKKRIPWVKYFFQILLPGYMISCSDRIKGQIKANESKTEAVTKSICSPTIGVVLMEPEIMQVPDTTENMFVGDIKIEIDDDKPFKKEPLANDTTLLTAIPVQGEVSEQSICEFPKINIKGRVVNDRDEPIPYASVMVKGSHNGTASGEDGSFIIKTETLQSSVLAASSVGFESKEIELKDYNLSDSLIVQLKANVTLGEVVIASEVCTRKLGGMMSVISINSTQAAITSLLRIDSVKIYPNPVRSGSVINLEVLKSGQGKTLIELYNMAGQKVYFTEVNMNNKNWKATIPLPVLVPGTYIVKLDLDEKKKTYTTKIIVQ